MLKGAVKRCLETLVSQKEIDSKLTHLQAHVLTLSRINCSAIGFLFYLEKEQIKKIQIGSQKAIFLLLNTSSLDFNWFSNVVTNNTVQSF